MVSSGNPNCQMWETGGFKLKNSFGRYYTHKPKTDREVGIDIYGTETKILMVSTPFSNNMCHWRTHIHFLRHSNTFKDSRNVCFSV